MTQETPSSEPVHPHADDAAAAPEAAAAEPARRPAREPQHRVPPAPARPQPSWFLSAAGEQLTREEMLARYRRQRGLPEDPFDAGKRPVPPAGYRERIMNAPAPVRFAERAPAESTEPPKKAAPSFSLGQTFAIAAAMALVAGGGAGVMSARFAASPVPAPAATLAEASTSAAQPLQPAETATPAAAPARDTVIDKKPISTATLQVADVSGETNSFIPLALHAEPAGLDTDMLLKISGVPEGAYLTSGHRQDDQVWALTLAETRGVKLVVPKAREPLIDLAVAAFEPKTGELAAPVKTMTVALKDVVVEPTSAPPPGQVTAEAAAAKSALPGSASAPVAIPAPQSVSLALAAPETAETRALLGTGDTLFSQGNVEAARKSYERAWGNDGSAAAAFGIARSYDPLVLATLPASTATPDKGQALQWYQRAASGGNPDAAEAIIRLQMKP